MMTHTMHGSIMILLQKQDQEQRHKGRSRDQIMSDMLNNVLGRGDLPNKATRTV